ncbi:hypothetical protein PBI_OMNICRON_36 [Mycobacterium phage Omnicron]|uniref:Lipoprotein n=1 Tax=Mycobacterium phage Omnicron TaxID=1541819 RepID=A0A088FUP8_9CAUD|nr:hypothetical protein PBI_OMNICRON_36 [Mycobacterium phage Omnicron]AIM50369.1 hypothetical protein PBI_OMNICRON_36 [Mycobacterium phage Omnicron]
MRKRLAAAAVAVVAVLSLSACEGGGGGGGDTGPNGVIFVPVQGNPVGIPVFF